MSKIFLKGYVKMHSFGVHNKENKHMARDERTHFSGTYLNFILFKLEK